MDGTGAFVFVFIVSRYGRFVVAIIVVGVPRCSFMVALAAAGRCIRACPAAREAMYQAALHLELIVRPVVYLAAQIYGETVVPAHARTQSTLLLCASVADRSRLEVRVRS